MSFNIVRSPIARWPCGSFALSVRRAECGVDDWDFADRRDQPADRQNASPAAVIPPTPNVPVILVPGGNPTVFARRISAVR